jgi:signal transduction histidine kinase
MLSAAFTVYDVAGSLTGLVLSGSLAFRRTHPVVALVIGTAAAIAQAVLLKNLTVSVVAVPILVYTFARWFGRPLARSAVGLALMGAIAGPVWWLTSRAEPVSTNDILLTVVAYASFIIVAHGFGELGRERAEAQAQREHDLVERRRLEFAEQARATAAEERNEIAREVHDIVAHSLSVIAVQAEGGRSLVTRSPERAAEILSVIADESRSALNEIRDMVGLLRRGSLSAPENYRPAPGLDDVKDLIDRVGADALPSAPDATDPRLDLLTTREIEVLQEIAAGANNREIGARLFMADGTVKTHIGNQRTPWSSRRQSWQSSTPRRPRERCGQKPRQASTSPHYAPNSATPSHPSPAPK